MKSLVATVLVLMLLLLPALNAGGETGKFLDSEGNVREKPEAKAKLLFTSKAGEQFSVLERLGEKWVKVKMQDGRAGWTSVINVKFDIPALAMPEKKSVVVEPQQSGPVTASQGQLQEENDRLKQEVSRLEQEKMLIESSSNQSQFLFEKLKAELKEMTALKDKLEAENRKLKEQTGK